jgi:hypothetical protein
VDVKGRPPDVPVMAWAWSHSDPLPWYAVGIVVVVLLVGAVTAFVVVPGGVRKRPDAVNDTLA